MKPREIFKLAVRLLGLVFVYLGISNLPMVIETGKAVEFVVCYFAFAWWLLGGASLLVNRACPEAGKETEEAKEVSSARVSTTEA